MKAMLYTVLGSIITIVFGYWLSMAPKAALVAEHERIDLPAILSLDTYEQRRAIDEILRKFFPAKNGDAAPIDSYTLSKSFSISKITISNNSDVGAKDVDVILGDAKFVVTEGDSSYGKNDTSGEKLNPYRIKLEELNPGASFTVYAFYDQPSLLVKGDIKVIADNKVIPFSRIWGVGENVFGTNDLIIGYQLVIFIFAAIGMITIPFVIFGVYVQSSVDLDVSKASRFYSRQELDRMMRVTDYVRGHGVSLNDPSTDKTPTNSSSTAS